MNTTASINPQDIKFLTLFGKSYHGNRADTKIDFKGGKRVRFTTCKRYNGHVCTTAQFMDVETKNEVVIESYIVFQDFNAVIGTHKDIKRATKKAIVTAHNACIKENLPSILERLEKRYGKLELA